MDPIRRQMRIQASANSDIKLSKAAQKIKDGDEKIILKSLDNFKMNDWLGLAQNPLLTNDQIIIMFKRLHRSQEDDKWDNEILSSTKTRNAGLRGKIKKLLALHSNLSSEMITKLISARTFRNPPVLGNPNITDEQLDLYFKHRVIVNDTSYNMVAFSDLMEQPTISPKVALKWFNDLLPMADWTYHDNNWYSIINSFLDYDKCPSDILFTVASTPLVDGKVTNELGMSWMERNREQAVNHPNAKSNYNALMGIAYEITKDTKYITDELKSIFFMD